MRPTFASLLALTYLAAPALGSSPVVRGLKPVGGQRGTEVAVTFTGQRLADTREVLFYGPGIRVIRVGEVTDSQVKATLRIDPDARLGLHDFRVRTATGISPLRTFSVGALKEVAEAEPNNDFARPQPIAMGVTVNGVADREDVDHYAVRARKGERITAEVEGIRLGLTMFDPYVAVLDPGRFELASSDDSALTWQDGFVSVVAPKDGTYTVVVRESAYAGNPNCLYRLHVGNFPRPTATVPAGGKVGETVTVRWIGDVFGERTTTHTLPTTADGDFGLVAEDGHGTAPYPNIFRLSPFGNVVEAEPDGAVTTATPFTPPVALNGVIGAAGDVDRYAFTAAKGQTLDVRVFARQVRSPLDPVLAIHRRGGRQIAGNDDAGGPDSYLRFTAPEGGDFVVSVTDHLGDGGPDYAYRIEVTPVAPRLTLSTPNEAPRRGTGTQAVAVPRGNRQALLINASRADFGGALVLEARGLPAGVAFEAEAMAAGGSVQPVLFSAAADAPTAVSLAKISGRPVDTRLEVPCEFTSTAELVNGQNNVPFWTRTVDALAVAVTDEVPFLIDVVEPKVPIVRGGTMDLKVVAKRKPGFTAPIAVSLPWNPPGIASKGGVVIPEGKDEATIPVNANSAAELATWKVVVNGTFVETPPGPPPANGNRRGRNAGRLTVSSLFVRLTVAAPLLSLTLPAVSVERGKSVDLAVGVERLADFDGEAKVTLVGLPHRVTTDPALITRDTREVVFRLTTDPATPPGETRGLFCQVIVTRNGEPITHNLGSGRLRVDSPLARGTGTPAPRPGAVVAANGRPAKPLSRLEKLRLENRDRANAGLSRVEQPEAVAGPPEVRP